MNTHDPMFLELLERSRGVILAQSKHPLGETMVVLVIALRTAMMTTGEARTPQDITRMAIDVIQNLAPVLAGGETAFFAALDAERQSPEN